jgi:membrane-associated phospholipid phosphatase/tRNA A-37 threonylcarbamoyl transferase component Bud32
MGSSGGQPPLRLDDVHQPTAAGRPHRRRRPTGEPPPLPRSIATSGLWWATGAASLVALAIWMFVAGNRTLGMAAADLDGRLLHPLIGLRTSGLTSVLQALAGPGLLIVIQAVRWPTILVLLFSKRFLHLFVFLGSFLAVAVVVASLAHWLQRPRPFGVELLGRWGGYAMPSRPIAYFSATLIGAIYSLLPQGPWRQRAKWVAALLITVAAVARVYLGVDAPSDVLVGAVVGTTIPLLAFRLLTPNQVFPVTYRRGRTAHIDIGGRRGEAIETALKEQLGVQVLEVKRFGTKWSASSTPLRIRVKGDPDVWLFAKLYATNHVRADRWYKLGRTLRYGRLEDEKSFNSVRRLAEREDYALGLMSRARIPSPVPFGVVEITPEREYLVVAEFLQDARELGEVEVDESVIDDGLGIIRKLWDAGLAHRDIKPANLLVRHGHVYLIDVFLTQVRPSPWRQAADLANMMLSLATRSSPQLVYQRTQRQFSDSEITEAFAVTSGITMPAQLRQMARDGGRDLQAEFLRLLPERPRPVSTQRWTPRRLGLMVATLLVVVFILAPATLLASPFGTEDLYSPAIGRAPYCESYEALWLISQSVPSASQVPCVQLLPAGWSAGAAQSRNGQSSFALDSDRVGAQAVRVLLAPSCTMPRATRVPSDQPGTRRYQVVTAIQPGRRYQGAIYYVLAGGCVTYRLDFRSDEQALPLGEVSLTIGFVTRDQLRNELRQRSRGRLELDQS